MSRLMTQEQFISAAVRKHDGRIHRCLEWLVEMAPIIGVHSKTDHNGDYQITSGFRGQPAPETTP